MAHPLILPTFEGVGLGAGDALQYLPGSGLSQPMGLEAMFVYNGLTMNDMGVIDKFKIDEVEGFGDPEVRDAREPLPADHGEQALKAYYGGRPMSLTGRIQVGNVPKIRDMDQAMRSAFISLVEQPLVITTGDDATAAFLYCRKVAPRTMKESQTTRLYQRDFLLQLRASNPRFFSLQTESLSGAYADGEIVFTPFNGGNFWARPVLIFHGPQSNVTVTCEDTGRKLWIDGQVPNYLTYTIDVHKRTMKDDQGYNRFDQLRSLSRRIELPPGTSTVTVQAENSEGSRVDLWWRHTWL